MSLDQRFIRSVQDSDHNTKPPLKMPLPSDPLALQELSELGGLKNIEVRLPDWPVSDDTVLHLATAEGLATGELENTPRPSAVSSGRPSWTHSVSNKHFVVLI